MDVPMEQEQGKHLSDTDIRKILGLAKALMPQRKIATLMKCTRKTVQHVLATFLFETFQRRNSQPERPRKTTKREDRYILHIIKQNDSAPLHDIINIINNKIDVPISEHTV